ncbi:MAG TPA: hypothetical protein VJ485_00395 [archaeon]|nr:hypothetical protein [archaeon]
MVDLKYKISQINYNFGDGCDAPSIVLGLSGFEKESGEKCIDCHGIFLYLTKSEFSEFTDKKYRWDGTQKGTERLRGELIGKTGKMKLAMD